MLEIETTFAERLNKALLESGLTQKQLSERTGISKSLLNKYLKGKSQASNFKLTLLANELLVNPLWLIGYNVSKDYNDILSQMFIENNNNEQRRIIAKIDEKLLKIENVELLNKIDNIVEILMLDNQPK